MAKKSLAVEYLACSVVVTYAVKYLDTDGGEKLDELTRSLRAKPRERRLAIVELLSREEFTHVRILTGKRSGQEHTVYRVEWNPQSGLVPVLVSRKYVNHLSWIKPPKPKRS